MKKNIVLLILFVLPIVAYLFFASGVNSFAKLPVITKSIPEISNFKSLDSKKILLTNKITILGFTGTNLTDKKGNFFNLIEKIYKKNREFKDFQIVFIAPVGTENQATEMLTKLNTIEPTTGWNFVFASPKEIDTFYSKLKLEGKLDANHGTTNVYIVDKKRNLRGRKGVVKGEEEYKEGYSTTMVSELYNEMNDDVKIILAEYRLALKRNHNASRQI
jgi:hypothetical protein